jgi:arginase
MSRFVIVPQWQGSGSSRAMRLVDGAMAIAGDLPRSACTIVEVPVEAGESLGSPIRRLSSLIRVRDQIEDAVHTGDGPALVVGGDCGVALGAVGAVATADTALLWLDAHADLQSPETSETGAFHGMVLRAILGDGLPQMALESGIVTPARVVLAGTREIDPPEADFIARGGMTVLSPDALTDPGAIATAIEATGAREVYIHVDLDVMDPGRMSGLSHPVPFGAEPADVVAVIREVRSRMPMVGASLSEFSPSSPAAAVDDLGTILRVIGALA